MTLFLPFWNTKNIYREDYRPVVELISLSNQNQMFYSAFITRFRIKIAHHIVQRQEWNQLLTYYTTKIHPQLVVSCSHCLISKCKCRLLSPRDHRHLSYLQQFLYMYVGLNRENRWGLEHYVLISREQIRPSGETAVSVWSDAARLGAAATHWRLNCSLNIETTHFIPSKDDVNVDQARTIRLINSVPADTINVIGWNFRFSWRPVRRCQPPQHISRCVVS